LADFGAYRDLQRHRILTQMRQDLTILHGYETPEEILDIGLKKEYDHAMKASAELYQKIYARFPKEAQYVVPFAYRVRWMMKMNLREAYHFIELRSGIQGHPSYRRIAQLLYHEVARVHPTLAQNMKFVDMTPSQTSFHLSQKPISNLYALARFQAEMKKEEKKEAREEKKVQ
jgi:thymidylate synthase ThyX